MPTATLSTDRVPLVEDAFQRVFSVSMSSRAVRRCRGYVHGYALPYRLDLLTVPTTACLEDVPEPRRARTGNGGLWPVLQRCAKLQHYIRRFCSICEHTWPVSEGEGTEFFRM
jgi:hypothetical protein